MITGKGNKERTVYLNDACKSAVSAYMRVRPHDGVKDKALFLSSRNQRISPKTVQHMVYAYLDKAGLGDRGLSVHKLRHTGCHSYVPNGHVDLLLLKEILGHETWVLRKSIPTSATTQPRRHRGQSPCRS